MEYCIVFLFSDFQVLLNKDKMPVSVRHQADSNITRWDFTEFCLFRVQRLMVPLRHTWSANCSVVTTICGSVKW